MVYYRDMKQAFYEISQAALNLVFPIFCQGCGKALPYNSKIYLCEACIGSIRLNSLPFCTIGDKGSFFKTAWHCSKHEGIIKELIHKFKYKKRLFLKDTLVDILRAFTADYTAYGNADIVTAVPLHISDKRKRGFNQSEVLAEGLALQLNMEYGKNSLLKLKKTREQVSLKRAHRVRNLKGAFAPGDISGFGDKDVLLIDDVFTTGSTIDECSRILVQNGAKSVSALTLTKGI